MTDLINLYRQAEDYFFKSISLKCLDLGKGIKAYMTGVPLAGLNPIYITSNVKDIDKIVIQAKQFYDSNNLSFVVVIPQDFCAFEIKNILKVLNYSRTDKSVAMAIRLEDFIGKAVNSFDDEILIRPNDDQLKDWIIPLVSAFESTIESGLIYVDAHERAMKKDKTLRHFSLYKQGVPMASITLSLWGDIARIDDVGILPEFQGKGYATRLMTYVLSEAKRLGACHCFLESSDSGLRIYQKLGFEPLFKNNIYFRIT